MKLYSLSNRIVFIVGSYFALAVPVPSGTTGDAALDPLVQLPDVI
jgi:hypothetical protein